MFLKQSYNKSTGKPQLSLNIDFNLNSIFSLLTFNRFLFPSSKKKAFEIRGRFFDRYDFDKDGQSVLGADKAFKKWVLSQEEYQTTKEKDKKSNKIYQSYQL